MAHVAIVVEQLRQHAEEEEMATYRKEDLDGWEFKILRSATSQFNDPAKLQLALAEEATFGWELVEKFDNQRLRLKRPISARNLTTPTGSDAYRTEFGMSEGRLIAWVILSVILLIVLIGVLASLFT